MNQGGLQVSSLESGDNIEDKKRITYGERERSWGV